MDMGHILIQTGIVIKTIGRETMLELAKNTWIKFCIGIAIAAYPVAHLIEAVSTIFK
jgi:hypothetical protein